MKHYIYILFCLPLSLIYCSCFWWVSKYDGEMVPKPTLDLPRCISSPFDEDGSLEVPGAHVACPVLEGRGRSGGVLSAGLLSYTPEN